jgi:hypothetical protein
MKIQHVYVLLFMGVTLLSACKKDKNIDPNRKGNLRISFENKVGNQSLQLNSGAYQNILGEDFTVSMLNYYISNISLVNEDGSVYTVPQDESYFLIKEEVASTKSITIPSVPEGNYKSIRFMIGVDSLRSTLPISERTGVLDPSGEGQGMYWTWNSGYIFVKMEGTSSFSTQTGNVIKYHIGGFGGYNSPTINNIKTVELSFGSDVAEVREEKGASGPMLHIEADVLKMFNGSTNISFAENPVVISGAFSANVANNYANMFKVDHVHN